MLNALRSLGHDQFEFARWSPKVYTQYKIIRVSVVSENEKRWNTVIQNLITTADSTVIRTAYVYDYQPRQHIFFRNHWWEIRAVTDVTQDVNPQALGLVKSGTAQYILEVVKVDGYDVG